MVRISISIPEDLKNKLDETAQERDRSVSWIAREIIQDYYNKNKEN